MPVPKVSVVIPAYNHAKFIAASIDSVLQQTFADYEIIVVNDGSPDNTAEVLSSLRNRGQVIYLEQANSGQAAARNRGIRTAQGEYIALLDDDDCWPPNKLAWQVERLESDPTLLLVAGDTRESLADVLRDQVLPVGDPDFATLESIIVRNPIVSPGQTLIRKSALAAVGGFNESIWGADDWDLYLRLSRLGRLELHLRPTLFYRRHAGNASHHMVRLLRNVLRVLHHHLPAVAPAVRQECYAQARRWIYTVGIRGMVYDLRQNWRRRDPIHLVDGVSELFRRLCVLKFDPIVLRNLLHDCITNRYA